MGVHPSLWPDKPPEKGPLTQLCQIDQELYKGNLKVWSGLGAWLMDTMHSDLVIRVAQSSARSGKQSKTDKGTVSFKPVPNWACKRVFDMKVLAELKRAGLQTPAGSWSGDDVKGYFLESTVTLAMLECPPPGIKEDGCAEK